jgi:hypothetical protein
MPVFMALFLNIPFMDEPAYVQPKITGAGNPHASRA